MNSKVAFAAVVPLSKLGSAGGRLVCSQKPSLFARRIQTTRISMGPPGLLSAKEVQTRKEAGGCTHIDVRTSNEFAGGHPANSVNVPYMVAGAMGMSKSRTFLSDFEAAVPGKNAMIIVSCQSGKRSAMAVEELVAEGYENLADQEGGFMAWASDETLPVEN